MEENNEETSHEYNEYLIKIYESLKKKGGRAGKQRQLGQMEWIPLRKLRIDLANVGMTGCT